MRLAVITTERFLDDEAQALNLLFDSGLERLHLRKPKAAEEEMRSLLVDVEPRCRDRIVVHDHFGLAREFGLAGVHLNRRNPDPPHFPVGSISRSCHSLDEVAGSAGKYNYLFLSPIFDSISKSGYAQAFTEEELLGAMGKGIINEHVYALGGIDEKNIPYAARMGFGGVAILGALWQDFMRDGDYAALRERFMDLSRVTEKV